MTLAFTWGSGGMLIASGRSRDRGFGNRRIGQIGSTAAWPSTTIMSQPALSLTQAIEALENEPWTEEDEMALCALETSLYAGEPSPALLQSSSVAMTTNAQAAELLDGVTQALSQDTDYGDSLPWSSSAEAAVQKIEQDDIGRSDYLTHSAGHTDDAGTSDYCGLSPSCVPLAANDVDWQCVLHQSPPHHQVSPTKWSQPTLSPQYPALGR